VNTPPDPMAEHQVVGARLREARLAVGLTQADTASALGISRPAVAALEKGARKVSGLELRRLARLYQRSVGWLLGDDAEPAATDAVLQRATAELSPHDKEQVLRFAQFLAAQPVLPSDGKRPRPRPRPPTPGGEQ
jgi:transcriptional regulator with XRE-family HTH domain